ncbi:MAG: hypothetical protein CMJ50_00010 [Planctomycetaceae bacterium]|nr:hypothetical protein [Planctomycetaceae bacterium]
MGNTNNIHRHRDIHMQLKIQNLHTRQHKALLVTATQAQVDAMMPAIEKERMGLKMDIGDIYPDDNGKQVIELITHRSHHKRAASWLRDLIQDVQKNVNSSVQAATA